MICLPGVAFHDTKATVAERYMKMTRLEHARHMAIICAALAFAAVCVAQLVVPQRKCDHKIRWTCDDQAVEMRFREGSWEASRK